jgi:hypothetical protein
VKWEDFEREPCGCGECVQAGVSGRPQKRDPQTGKWLHGYDLKRLYQAQDSFWKKFKAMASTKGMR